jgi:hypothetical protein
MLDTAFADDFFGDHFRLDDLPLPRQARGYAVQMLDTDTLLDSATGEFMTMRDQQLHGLFASFAAAHGAASRWVRAHCPTPEEHRLAIVPAGFDDELQRHILIYGVLRGQP